ncbi:unnamed protein product [Larinioides sclopetarius]|uniref:Photosystem II protein I n=1 Tax=Larinioides sclopetarius TaxID=280406 RepID=A0AAV2B9X7_9ARAC
MTFSRSLCEQRKALLVALHRCFFFSPVGYFFSFLASSDCVWSILITWN